MARLLVVDDDPAQLRIQRLVLESAGHQIQTAETPAQALRLLRETHPEVMLMDLRLPKVEDGLTLIRQIEHTAKVVVLSGYPEDLCGLPEAGLVQRVLAKPVGPKVLLRAIAEILLLFFFLLLGIGQMAARTLI